MRDLVGLQSSRLLHPGRRLPAPEPGWRGVMDEVIDELERTQPAALARAWCASLPDAGPERVTCRAGPPTGRPLFDT